jgi:uncharacterized protein
MNHRARRLIRPLLLATFVTASVGVVAPSAGLGATQVPSTSARSLTTLGEAALENAPAIARAVVGVEVGHVSLANATADAQTRSDAVLRSLRNSGIQEHDVRTAHFAVTPDYDYQEKQPGRLRGFTVQHLLEVRTRDMRNVGGLLDAAMAAGATRIDGVHFEADDADQLTTNARAAAFRHARAKAEHLARDAGMLLGGPLAVEELDAIPLPAAVPAVQTSISPGRTTIEARLRVTWSTT